MPKSKFFEGKTGLLYAGIIGLIASDIIPTGGDCLYFYKHKQWRDQWAKGELTSKQYWTRELFGYYAFNSAWWLMVGTVVYFTPKFENKIKVGLALIGAGAVFTVVYKNIQKDESQQLAERNAVKEKLLETADATDINDAKNT
ncbi:MAG: hypothetical protein PHW73_00260 [Atribacterota bacterium]|nr:hypothetical protein [Atribacterota bacterium]